jgi:hypothetical protein
VEGCRRIYRTAAFFIPFPMSKFGG